MNIPPSNQDPDAATPEVRAQVAALFTEAHRQFQSKNRKQAALTLTLAETTARHHNLHREAARFRQAITILAQGGTPKLLARPLPKQ